MLLRFSESVVAIGGPNDDSFRIVLSTITPHPSLEYRCFHIANRDTVPAMAESKPTKSSTGPGEKLTKSKSSSFVDPHPDDAERVREFAAALRAIREAKAHGPDGERWTQVEVARRFNVSQPRWSQLEQGKLEPTPRMVWRLERVFGVSPGSLSQILGYVPTAVRKNDTAERLEAEFKMLLTSGRKIQQSFKDGTGSISVFVQWFEKVNEYDLKRMQIIGEYATEIDFVATHIQEVELAEITERIKQEAAKLSSLTFVPKELHIRAPEFAAALEQHAQMLREVTETVKSLSKGSPRTEIPEK
jgi:transcriptional regulator with XRE-family HTH domain